MKILVVDDDEISLTLLEETLTIAGHEPLLARNGQDAWRTFTQENVRLVITDWYMPELDGIELCQRIRNMDTPGYVYIIMLTSHSQKYEILKGLSSGADDFICKPFDPAELTVRVRNGLRILSMETRDVTIFALAKLAESRDPETGAHLERMRIYSKILAETLAKTDSYNKIITQEFIRNIYLTSPLHDIGKISIPDCVLLKPGRLSDEEWVIMKTHPETGAKTLGAALQQFPEIGFLKMARDIALTHHERYGGQGYPHSLKGEEIPLAGRIVTIADVYDALTSRRVYKEAFTPHVAKSIIIEEAGKQFDPDVVQAFLDSEQAFNETYSKLPREAG